MTSVGDVVVGVVGRPWGLRGGFLVNPLGTDPKLLVASGRLRLRASGREREFRILDSHVSAGRLVVKVEGCETPEDAETFRGSEVVLEPEAFEPPPEGSFYPHELKGMRVVDRRSGLTGSVERVIDTAGADLLAVRIGEREVLIPFAEAICRVDRSQRTIEIDPPDGLLDLE